MSEVPLYLVNTVSLPCKLEQNNPVKTRLDQCHPAASNNRITAPPARYLARTLQQIEREPCTRFTARPTRFLRAPYFRLSVSPTPDLAQAPATVVRTLLLYYSQAYAPYNTFKAKRCEKRVCGRERVCVCVCLCARKRQGERDRQTECVCVSLCAREREGERGRERERESVCVCMSVCEGGREREGARGRERERECVCVCMSVCEGGRERERDRRGPRGRGGTRPVPPHIPHPLPSVQALGFRVEGLGFRV